MCINLQRKDEDDEKFLNNVTKHNHSTEQTQRKRKKKTFFHLTREEILFVFGFFFGRKAQGKRKSLI